MTLESRFSEFKKLHEAHVGQQKRQYDDMNETLRQLRESNTRIETALMGDEKAGIEGVVKKLGRHDKYISNSKRRTAYYSGFGAAIVAAWEFVRHKFGL